MQVLTPAIDLSEFETSLNLSCILDVETYFHSCTNNQIIKTCYLRVNLLHQNDSTDRWQASRSIYWHDIRNLTFAVEKEQEYEIVINVTKNGYQRKEVLFWKETPTVRDSGNFGCHFCFEPTGCHFQTIRTDIFGVIYSLYFFITLLNDFILFQLFLHSSTL